MNIVMLPMWVLSGVFFSAQRFPAAVQPLKSTGPRANSEQRLAMLRLALTGEPNWRISTVELDRGGVSYTVDTLRAIHAERPDDRLFFMIGADAILDLPH